MKTNKYIISGGGTGGHIFPALSIANRIKKDNPEAEILFVGSLGKMEMKKIPDSGFNIIGLSIDGFQRHSYSRNILFPFKLFVSLIKSFFLIVKFKPDAVIGTGGFASGPVIFVSQILGYPSLIQEQNSYAGVTNRILSKRANFVSVAYTGMEKFFPKEKIILTGNPVRKDIIKNDISSSEAKLFFGLDPEKPTVGVIGGSLGSLRINEVISNNLKVFSDLGIQVIWQCGKLYFEEYKVKETKSVKIFPFISKMSYLYKAIDVLISRAGASTVSEICITKTPSILVPSPNVAENHQYHNAMVLFNENASAIIEESDLNNNFKNIFNDLWLDKLLRNEMKKNLKKLSKPEATEQIVKYIKQISIDKI